MGLCGCFPSKKSAQQPKEEPKLDSSSTTKQSGETTTSSHASKVTTDATPKPSKPSDEVYSATPGMFITQQRGHLTDRYQRVKKLGAGAYGEVLLCRDKQTNAERAIKIIKKSSVTPGAPSATGSSLLDEVAVLKRLDHPNIMKLYEFFEDKRNYYLVSELYLGGELFDEIIHRQKFGEADAALILKQVLSGVTYLHKHNIVHRDLKPENLLLESKNPDALIKIVDFGLSAYFDESTKMKERLGTAYYIAPEVLKKKYDEKCDVWSSGVILYILLCGYPPFGGQTDHEILKRVEKGKFSFEPPEWSKVSEEAKNLITLMLTYDPAQRISAEEALSHPWIQKKSKEAKVDSSVLTETLGNMRKFQGSQKLAQAALLFMGSKLATIEETKELTKIFRKLDKNGDGRLDKKELIEGYRQLKQVGGTSDSIGDTLTEEKIVADVEQIMSVADFDESGDISYSEFIVATAKKNVMLDRQKLQQAFEIFDVDRSGTISNQELAKLFGRTHVDDPTWQDILKGVDKNNDGEIDFEEFEFMMQKICEERA